MAESSSPACVLVVADAERIRELLDALDEPLPTVAANPIDVLASSGGDDTIDLFAARKPQVVVVTASLEAGDATALVHVLRDMVPKAEVGIVVIGDPDGPVRNVVDAIDMAPDRFVTRPLAPRALRFAVASALEAVMLVRGQGTPRTDTAPGTQPSAVGEPVEHEPTEGSRAAQRARWEALADSLVEGLEPEEHVEVEAPALPPVIIHPRRGSEPDAPSGMSSWRSVGAGDMVPWVEPGAPAREPTLIIPDLPPDLPEPSPPEIIEERVSDSSPASIDLGALTARTRTVEPPVSRTRTGDLHVEVAERDQAGSAWSEPMPLAELLDARSSSDRLGGPARDSESEVPTRDPARPGGLAAELSGELPLDDFDDALVLDDETGTKRRRMSEPRLEVLADLPDALPDAPPSSGSGRDFARQLRAKMSMMAQRLFQGGAESAPAPADLAPRHDHHTEIDLASLGEELPLGGGVTEIEARAVRQSEARELTTSPGSWDTQVRERGLPDLGEVVRGTSDAPMLLAKMFAAGATGRVVFKRDGAEKVVFFDQGRPVFASSSEVIDRMGGLLVREGKITAAQYERCQAVVAESGRRMGEILVDLGYLKRRELLPAVRRHVEDIVYSLFGWDRGHYQIFLDTEPCAERIRLSRHPAALILEGVRRKLDRGTLDKLVGPPSTVIEVSDRERLGAVINTGDLAPEERAALAAIDNQADLTTVARTAGIDLADILPLAWGLVVLGLAHARRTDTEVHDESTALVGETDLAIDRERVRARWQLVTEADYFALLGVRRDATGFEIRRAYQAARRDFAVDSFPADLRRELAQELDDIANVLDEAFRVLRDDRLRTTYLSNLVG